MSGTAVNHWYEDLETSALGADRPMDTRRAWTLMNNIAHMCDSSGQYRVNSVSQLAIPVFILNDGTYRSEKVFSFYFPVTMFYPGRYPNYDVRVAAKSATGTTVYVRCAVTAEQAAFPGVSSDPNVLGVLTGSTTSTSGEWCIDDIIDASGSSASHVDRGITITEVATGHVGDNFTSFIVLARADVTLTCSDSTSSDATCYFSGLQIREFTS